MDILNDVSFIKELNEKLKNGGVITFVTDTVWGVGCLPNNKQGSEKIYELKGRDTSKPLILMSNDIKYLKPYVANIPEKSQKLIDKYFPGALTLIFEKSSKTPNFICANKNTIGIRIPNNKIFERICEVVEGHVLATTSANLSNQPSAKNYQEAVSFIGDLVDYTFEDFGETAKGLESTVALAIDENIKILRQGSVHLN